MPVKQRTIRRGQTFPMVKCPNCKENVILSIEYWHTDCKPRNFTEEEYQELIATTYVYSDDYIPEGMTAPTPASVPEKMELQYPSTDDDYYPFWMESKSGSFYGDRDGVHMVITKSRNGKWSCGGYASGVENGDVILTWKRNFPSAEKAQANILKRLEMRNR